MLRALGTLAVAGIAGYVAANGGTTPWFDLGSLPAALIAFCVVSAGIVFSLRAI